jgi:hypothetical protein
MFTPLSIGPIRHLLFAVLFASVLADISGSAQQLGPRKKLSSIQPKSTEEIGMPPQATIISSVNEMAKRLRRMK